MALAGLPPHLPSPALWLGTAGNTLQHLPLPSWQRGGFATVFVAADLSPLFLPSASHGSLQ